MSPEESGALTSAERLRRNQVLRDLLAQLDLHAPGERAHAERVAVYSLAVGEKLGMSDGDLLMLRYAAELHDIGKLNINPELLSAPRPLDSAERVILESHVSAVQSLLEEHDWLAPAIPYITHHHERWEGGGYPDRLAGLDIPLEARIIGTAETLDVMLQGAPWRAPFSEDVAIAAIKGLSGTWFDPAVVEVLVGVQPIIQPVLD